MGVLKKLNGRGASNKGAVNSTKRLQKPKKTSKKHNQQINQTFSTQNSTFPAIQQFNLTETQQFQQENSQDNTLKNPLGAYSDIVSEWERQVTLVKQHPLSQVRVINATLLDTLTEVLRKMDGKLAALAKLDDILGILKEVKSSLSGTGVYSRRLDKAIEEIEDITIKDEQVLRILSQEGRKTADEISQVLGITRSTASLRLNKLYNSGVLDKKPQGKKIFFEVKSA